MSKINISESHVCLYVTNILFSIKTILHFRLGNITGSAISSAVLWMNLGDGNSTGSNNTEGDDWYLTDEEVAMYCGVNDCPWNNISNPIAEEPEEKRVSSSGIPSQSLTPGLPRAQHASSWALSKAYFSISAVRIMPPMLRIKLSLFADIVIENL